MTNATIQSLLVPALAGALLAGVYVELLFLSAQEIVRRRSLQPLFLGALLRIALLATAGAILVYSDAEPSATLMAVAGFTVVRAVRISCCARPQRAE